MFIVGVSSPTPLIDTVHQSILPSVNNVENYLKPEGNRIALTVIFGYLFDNPVKLISFFDMEERCLIKNVVRHPKRNSEQRKESKNDCGDFRKCLIHRVCNRRKESNVDNKISNGIKKPPTPRV